MRTRRLHARLAYVKRADNRASVAFAAASAFARTPRPPRVAYAEASCRPRLRGKKRLEVGLRIACLAWLGTLAHMMHTRRCQATARTLMRTLGKSLRRAPTPCDNHIQRESISASSAQKYSAIALDTIDCDPLGERMAAKSARISDPMHLPCTAKLRISVLYGHVKLKSS